jgi:hypothetical protein
MLDLSSVYCWYPVCWNSGKQIFTRKGGVSHMLTNVSTLVIAGVMTAGLLVLKTILTLRKKALKPARARSNRTK